MIDKKERHRRSGGIVSAHPTLPKQRFMGKLKSNIVHLRRLGLQARLSKVLLIHGTTCVSHNI